MIEVLALQLLGFFNKLEAIWTKEFKTLASLCHSNIFSVLDYGFNDQRNPLTTYTVQTGFFQYLVRFFGALRYCLI